MSNNNVVTRFAPSPTGFLHIGGARTALFNWLFAKRHGGKMLLRIEDTDIQRSTDEAIDAIKEGLSWMGLNWDGDAVSQHGNMARHQEIAEELLASGSAYKCYSTPQELTQMREKAQAEGRRASYDGTWRDRDPSEAPEGVPFVVRIKSPQDGQTIIEDKVQGEVSFPNADLDDFVILRSDGTPTYMLAVVVDDHDMGVTHIIRGDDHLTNAARQALIYKALGWDMPIMAHIPLIHGPDGAKLSKRHGALGVEAYREMGYMNKALRNYLVRLGWSHGDDEIMGMQQMIEWFGFDGMNKAASRFDFQKLESVNAHWIKNSDDRELLDVLIQTAQFLGDAKTNFPSQVEQLGQEPLLKLMPALKDRAKTLGELIDGAQFLFLPRPIQPDEKAKTILDDGGRDVLKLLLPQLEKIVDWQASTIEETVRAFGAQNDLKLGKIAQPLRCATTGTTSSPAVFDVLGALSLKECIQRIEDQI